MKTLLKWAVSVLLVCSVMGLSGCGLYQGKTEKGRRFEFQAYGLGIDYVAVDFGGVIVMASGGPNLLLPLGFFSQGLLNDRGFKCSGVILAGYYGFGKTSDSDPGVPGFLGGWKVGPVSWSAKRAGNAATLFPEFFDKQALPAPDRHEGNHTISTAVPMELRELKEGFCAREEGLSVSSAAPDHFRVAFPEEVAITALAVSYNCGADDRARVTLLDGAGNPAETVWTGSGSLVPAGEYILSVSTPSAQGVYYALQLSARRP